MRIVIEIDDEAGVTQQSAVRAAESSPAVNAGAAPATVTSVPSIGISVQSGGADVVNGGAAGVRAETNSGTGTDTALDSADAIDAGPGPQF